MDKRAFLAWSCVLFQFLLVTLVDATAKKGARYLSECYLRRLRAQKLTWTPGRNFNVSITAEDMMKLYGSSQAQSQARTAMVPLEKIYGRADSNKLIPDTFDARQRWPFCATTISTIKDTGFCASHWAMAVTQALSDRICIHSGGEEKNVQLSAAHLLECCKTCGGGCKGGYPFQAWKHIEHHAIVTGGDFKSEEGCKPYPISSPCNYLRQPQSCIRARTPALNCPAEDVCSNAETPKSNNYTIELVKHLPNADQYTQAWTPRLIKQDIVSNGPVTGTMRLFDDFLSYKSGIYSPSNIAKKLDDVTIKIFGWGKTRNLEYWLGSVPWGKNFGNKGFVKIKMGSPSLQLDHRMHSGIPILY